MTETYDGIVIGLGGIGSAAVRHLAARGKRVLGLEQYTHAHDRGSSHGGSRIIRQAYHENPSYVPLVLRAYELWQQLERDTGAELLTITGGLFAGTESSEVVQGSLQSAQEHGLGYELLDAEEIKRRFPVLYPRADDCAVYEKMAGILRPEAAVIAHLGRAKQNGAELHFEEPVSAWEITASGTVRVTTPKTVYEAEHLVLTPGAWAGDLLKLPSLPLQVRRHVMAWFEPDRDAGSFSPDRFPIFIWQADNQQIFYGFPVTGDPGTGAKVGIHSGGDICTPASIQRKVQAGDIAEIREQLDIYIPALNGKLLEAATCMYTMTRDEHFVVSPHPEHSQVILACGFSGHGFKFASVMGEILADFVIEGGTNQSIDFLSAQRFAK